MARESSEQKKAGRAPTSDRLRYDIDRGKGRDKVDFPDPAAAPLGTDSEAGDSRDGTDGIANDSVAEAWRAEMRRADPPSSGSAPRFYVVTTLLTVGLIALLALAALTTAPS